MTRKKRVSRTRADLERQLEVQLGFLRKSSDLYDQGDKTEAKRLATTLRILLSDEGRSTSLMGQLGLLGLAFTNTSPEPNPRNLLDHMGLLTLLLKTEPNGKESGSYEPRCLAPRGVPPGAMPFNTWWDKAIVLTHKPDLAATRRLLVGFVANQDGGAHVDPGLDPEYHGLSRGESLGWKLTTSKGEELPMGDPVAPCIRQIAHEVLATLQESRQVSPFVSRSQWYPAK